MTVDPYVQFGNDYDALTKAVADYKTALAEQQQAEDYYKNEILTKLRACTTVDQIMVYLQMYVFQNSLSPQDPHADACLLGIFGDQVGVQGKALAVNSYLTAVHNDLQNMVNSDSSDPQAVLNMVKGLNKILDDLQPGGLLDGVIDKSTQSQMLINDTNLRNEFFVNPNVDPADAKYNPTENDPPADPNLPYNYTYHFTYGEPDSTYLCDTFQEMQNRMQAPGDEAQATEGYKNLTNNLNANTSLTQTVNSALNQKINNLTNFIKTVLGFYQNGILQPTMKMVNTAIQNAGRG